MNVGEKYTEVYGSIRVVEEPDFGRTSEDANTGMTARSLREHRPLVVHCMSRKRMI